MAAGNYSEVRFIVSNASAEIDGATVILTIPGGNQTGLKAHFKEPFELKSKELITITIDISAAAS